MAILLADPVLGDNFEDFISMAEELVQKGIRIFSFSISFNESQWPKMYEFMTKHPNVLFVVAAGNQWSPLRKHIEIPQKFWNRPLPNLILIGKVIKTETNEYLVASTYGPRINLYCVACRSTSTATAYASQLLARAQFELQKENLASTYDPDGAAILAQLLKRIGTPKTILQRAAQMGNAQDPDAEYPGYIFGEGAL